MNKNKRRIAITTAAGAALALVGLPGVTPVNAAPSASGGVASVGLYLPINPLSQIPATGIQVCTNVKDPTTCKSVTPPPNAINSLVLAVEYTNNGGTPDVNTLAGTPLPSTTTTGGCAGKTGGIMQVLAYQGAKFASLSFKINGNEQAPANAPGTTNTGVTELNPGFCF